MSILLLAAAAAHAYEQPFPKYITADVTWQAPGGGTNRVTRGQLWFRDLPRTDAQGRARGFGSLGYYTGIKWFVPPNPGDIYLRREAGAAGGRTFLLHDPFGEETVNLAFDRIDVLRTEEASLEKLMDQSAGELDSGRGKPANDDWLDDVAADPGRSKAVIISSAPEPPAGRGKPPAGPPPSPLRLATPADIGVTQIPVSNVVEIVFLEASDGLQREKPVGRFVQYSNAARGDDGRVQPMTATFFGGPDGGERFAWGGFLADGTILLAGNYTNLAFLPRGVPITVLGDDPPPDAYPDVTQTDGRGRTRTSEPRRAAMLAFFSADLTRLLRVVRLPWAAGTLRSVVGDADGALYFNGMLGPHFDDFARGVKVGTIEDPEEVAAAKDAKRPREPGPDGYVVKLAPGGGAVAWVLRFKHAGVDIFMRPDRRLLARRRDDLFFVSEAGAVERGPVLEITGSNMAVDPRAGDMYFGGSYRSGTGLEPYVNPYLYKVDAAGKQVWTAYGWSGPIVGVEQHRLVSDSSVTAIQVAEDGSLTLTGWSDGGNTVLSYQPFDMRRAAPTSGFASSTWGATGGLTVRIAHIIHMDAETMEVDHCSQYVAYLPTSDVPTLLNIYDIHRTAAGDVGVVGGARTGFIETYDAWIESWYRQYRTNEFAEAKGGSFFTLFRPDFSSPRMSTRTPGVSGGRLAGRGNLLLLYGGATGAPEPDPAYRRAQLQPIVRRAVQPVNGGGLDGYAMLIDTQGQPRPPEIAERSWGEQAGAGRRAQP